MEKYANNTVEAEELEEGELVVVKMRRRLLLISRRLIYENIDQ